ILGAAANADLVLPFPGVSRRHARLLPVEGGGLLLIDLGSKNGLTLGGERVSQALLHPDGEIHLGGASLTLEEVASSAAEPAIAVACAPEPSLSSRATSALTLPSRLRSPRGALRLIRSLRATGADAASSLALARPVLGAETLILFHSDGDDVAVVECEGPL